MWKLKVAQGGGKRLTTTNFHTGRQYWEYVKSDDDDGLTHLNQIEKLRQDFTRKRFQHQQSSDLFTRMQLGMENPHLQIPAGIEQIKETEDITELAITTTLRRALGFFSTIQAHDGHWPAESAGPLFFLPPMVMTLYITGDLNDVLSPEHKTEMLRYIYNHQNEDGGWGLHVEGHSTMFGTVLNYITLRLLGQDCEGCAVSKARTWIIEHGGAMSIPSWGKFWLTVLGLHEWAGNNPYPPEIWLLPNLFPINPGMILCYARLTYLPISYLYGKKFTGAKTELIQSLKKEIYLQPYEDIDWNKARKTCAKEDLYYSHSLILDGFWEMLRFLFEPLIAKWPFCKLREKAMRMAMEHIHYEDKMSNYLCIGCIPKALCLLACWVENPNSEAYERHLARIPDYLWVAEDGMKVQTFGSQTWDASLAIQAILSSNIAEEYGSTLKKAHGFLRESQVQENPSGRFCEMYRHVRKGSWGFAARDHGWQGSDCTAEGLKAALMLSQMPLELVGDSIETEKLYDAVDVIMSLQNKRNGGFSSWEPIKAPSWLEKFNPTEIFEDALIEREYTECTSSAVQALTLFRKLHPTYRRSEVDNCIRKAIHYIESTQNGMAIGEFVLLMERGLESLGLWLLVRCTVIVLQ